jgi:zinc transporter ZupT
MPQVVVLVLAACGTALATGLGVIPVFLLGDRAAQLTPLLLGFAAGVMGVAAIAGLLIPATQEGSSVVVATGFLVGLGFLILVRRHSSVDAGFMGRSGLWCSARSSSLAQRRKKRSIAHSRSARGAGEERAIAVRIGLPGITTRLLRPSPSSAARATASGRSHIAFGITRCGG